MKPFLLPISAFCLAAVLLACNNSTGPTNSGSTGPVVDDVYEPDNAHDSAKKINDYGDYSIFQTHTLTANDQDWFYFTAFAGESYEIITSGYTDTYLALYNRTGALLLKEDNDGGANRNARIQWTCETSDTYYFQVKGSDGGQTGGYNVSLNNFIPVSPDFYEPDSVFTRASSVIVNDFAQAHTLTQNDQDWFKFNAVAGTNYTLQTTGSTDTYLELYNRDGNILLSEDDEKGTDGNARIAWQCDTSGTYYFKVRGFDGKQEGSYSVYLTGVLPDDFESDNAYTSSNPLTVNGTLQSHTLTQNDQDWFSFTAVLGGAYEFSTSGSTNTLLELYDQNGTTLLLKNDDGFFDLNADTVWACPASGVYYFKIRGSDGVEAGEYEVSIASNGTIVPPDSYEPDNVYTAATPITVNGAVQSHMLTFGDFDWFSFAATAGSTYTLQTTGSTDTYMKLYDRNATTILMEDDDDGTAVNALISWTCTVSGTYHFQVTGFGGTETGAYSVDVTR